MSATVGMLADRLTKSLNNPLSGRVPFLAIVPHPGIPTGDKINRRFPLCAAWSGHRLSRGSHDRAAAGRQKELYRHRERHDRGSADRRHDRAGAAARGELSGRTPRSGAGTSSQGRAGTHHHALRRGVRTAPMPFPLRCPGALPTSVHLNWIMKPSFNGCYDKKQSARSAEPAILMRARTWSINLPI
jgi:hypothetical protein